MAKVGGDGRGGLSVVGEKHSGCCGSVKEHVREAKGQGHSKESVGLRADDQNSFQADANA